MNSPSRRRQAGKAVNCESAAANRETRIGACLPTPDSLLATPVLGLVTLLVASCLAVSACHKKSAAVQSDPLLQAFDTEQDWTDSQHTIALNYQQAQGKRVFYNNCVWCHADATPAGPSNRGNLTTSPPLMNDGATLNGVSDEFMQNIITLGGSAMGKSAIMPPWGLTLTPDEVRAVIAFARAIAQPPYKPPLRPGPQYPVK